MIMQAYLSGAHSTCQLLVVPFSLQIGPSNKSPPAKATGNTDTFLVFLIWVALYHVQYISLNDNRRL